MEPLAGNTPGALEPIYAQDFLNCSHGFRPGRSAHQALEKIWQSAMGMGGGWVLDVDIRKYYDTLDHAHLRQLLQHRARDGVILRLIDKWLTAGVLEEGSVSYPEAGTPQGGVISRMLSNIYLHYVLDLWFEGEVKPRLKGRAELIRFADDFVIVFQEQRDAERVREVLPKRLTRYGLTIHPEKTRLVPFRCPGKGPVRPGSFQFLGFTHYWGRSRQGRWVVKRKTASNRFTRSITAIRAWCRSNRHEALRVQHETLSAKARGHDNCYGMTGNASRLRAFHEQVQRAWRYWLNRRRRGNRMPWPRFQVLLEHYPLPTPRVVHSIYAAKP